MEHTMSTNGTMSPNGIELFTGDGLIDEVVRRAGSGEAALRMLNDAGFGLSSVDELRRQLSDPAAIMSE
jgi:hypothetical protein